MSMVLPYAGWKQSKIFAEIVLKEDKGEKKCILKCKKIKHFLANRKILKKLSIFKEKKMIEILLTDKVESIRP